MKSQWTSWRQNAQTEALNRWRYDGERTVPADCYQCHPHQHYQHQQQASSDADERTRTQWCCSMNYSLVDWDLTRSPSQVLTTSLSIRQTSPSTDRLTLLVLFTWLLKWLTRIELAYFIARIWEENHQQQTFYSQIICFWITNANNLYN